MLLKMPVGQALNAHTALQKMLAAQFPAKQAFAISRNIARLGACPDVPKIDNPITTDFSFSELTFDDIPDPRLRGCLQGLPTSFSLPVKTVDLLRAAAAYLLMNSTDFVGGMERLDASWRPRKVVIADHASNGADDFIHPGSKDSADTPSLSRKLVDVSEIATLGK